MTLSQIFLVDCEVQEAIEAYEQCAHVISRYAQTYDHSKDYVPTEITHDEKYSKRHEVAALSEASKAKLTNMTSKKHHTRLQKGSRAIGGHTLEGTTSNNSNGHQDGQQHYTSHKGVKYKSQTQVSPLHEQEEGGEKSSSSLSGTAAESTTLISGGIGVLPEESQQQNMEDDNTPTPHGLDLDAINRAVMDDGIAHLHKIIFINYNPSTSYLSGVSSKVRSASSKITGGGGKSTKFARIGESYVSEEDGGDQRVEVSNSNQQTNAPGRFRNERRSMKLSSKNKSNGNKKSIGGDTVDGGGGFSKAVGSSGSHHWYMTLTFEDSDGNMIHPIQRTCTKDNEGETTIFGEEGDYMDIQIHARKQQFITNHVSIEIFEHKTMRDISFGKCRISLQSFLMNLEQEQELIPSCIEIEDAKGKVVGTLQIFGAITPKKDLDLTMHQLDNGMYVCVLCLFSWEIM